MIDTGCGCGDIYAFVKQQSIIKEKKIIVVNTHNHPEQTGGNFRFSTTGKLGMAHMVEDLCASGRDKYYTQLQNSSYHWAVIWTPGHTPDSLVLWYAYDSRLFVGDLFYRFGDIVMTSEYTSIREYEGSLRKVLDFINKQPQPKQVRYSASKNNTDSECLPTFKHFHRFLLAVLAGTHVGAPLRIDEAEGWRFETRDKAMRIVLGRDIVKRLNQAREKAQQYR
ncbi:metallo-beta-lactamase domain protein [Teladorsagia circumcincta]|uniref:Metallo-beta-lactamase domain protein n=1 Tax=Teladorsagia circumcincta TaxID=45464 RepID=A0A2G9TV12_TELCI|nr:metallo-beta-lactamase domain protein [Teladorsagia circumcincta]